MYANQILKGVADLWIMDIPLEGESTTQLDLNYTPAFRANAILRVQGSTLNSDLSYSSEYSHNEAESLLSFAKNLVSCKLLGFDSKSTNKAFDALATSLTFCQTHDSSKTYSAIKCMSFSKKIEEIEPDCCFGGPEEIPKFYNMIFIIPRSLHGSESGSTKPPSTNGDSFANQIHCTCIGASLLPFWISKWMDCQSETIIVLRDVEKTMGCGDAWSLNHHSCTSELLINSGGSSVESSKDAFTSSQLHRKFKFETTNLKVGFSAHLHLKKYFGIDFIQKATVALEGVLDDDELNDFLSTLLICVGAIELSL